MVSQLTKHQGPHQSHSAGGRYRIHDSPRLSVIRPCGLAITIQHLPNPHQDALLEALCCKMEWICHKHAQPQPPERNHSKRNQQLRRQQGGIKVAPIDLDAGDWVLNFGVKSPASLPGSSLASHGPAWAECPMHSFRVDRNCRWTDFLGVLRNTVRKHQPKQDDEMQTTQTTQL